MQHLLHARPAAGPLVSHDENIAGTHPVVEDGVDSLLLRLDHDRGSGEGQHARIDAGGLDHTAVGRQVPAQHRQSPVVAVGVRGVADASRDGVDVQRFVQLRRGERRRGAAPARGGPEQVVRLVGGGGAADVPTTQPLWQRAGVHGADVPGEPAGTAELTHQCGHAAGAVDVLDQVCAVGRDLAQTRHAARHRIDVVETEVQTGFVGGGQQMQDGVRGAAHRDVDGHRVAERGAVGDTTRQRGVIVVVVPSVRQLDHQCAGSLVETTARDMGRERGAVAG